MYSGGWACTILENDIKERKKVNHLVGHYVCGESIDVLGNLIVVGSYTSEKYLSVFE